MKWKDDEVLFQPNSKKARLIFVDEMLVSRREFIFRDFIVVNNKKNVLEKWFWDVGKDEFSKALQLEKGEWYLDTLWLLFLSS